MPTYVKCGCKCGPEYDLLEQTDIGTQKDLNMATNSDPNMNLDMTTLDMSPDVDLNRGLNMDPNADTNGCKYGPNPITQMRHQIWAQIWFKM